MSKKGKPQTTTTSSALDPQSQQYVNNLRGIGQGGAGVALQHPSSFFVPQHMSVSDQIGQFMNPYIQNVVGATRGEFDHLRNMASRGADQAATGAGAFGGSRHAVMEGARLGELDRAQASTIAQLMHGGHMNATQQGVAYAEHQRQLAERAAQEPLFRYQQALNFGNLGMGPVGQHGASTVPGPQRNLLGSAAGGAMAGAPFGPWGAAIGGGVGLLGGLFG